MQMTTLCHFIPLANFDEIIKVLQEEGKMLIDWFCFNCMQANSKKFQAIGVGKKNTWKISNFQSFENHISNLCKKKQQNS